MMLSEVYNTPTLAVLITLCTLDFLVVVALIVQFVVYLVLKKKLAEELMELAMARERYRRSCEELGVPFEENSDFEEDFEFENGHSSTFSTA